MPGAAAISRMTVVAIVKILRARSPKVVVDLGTGEGESLVTFCKYSNARKIFTVDDQVKFIQHAHRHPGVIATDHHRIHWIHAPLVRIPELDQSWYNTKFLEVIPHEIDLLFVDGPVGGVGRYPALPVFIRRLSKNASILLDDAHRQKEADILAKWLQFLCEEEIDYDYDFISTDRGLAHILLKGKRHG